MSAALRFVGIFATLVLFAGSALGQTLACFPSAPRTDPGSGFSPFGAAEQLLARGGQSGPAWEWALGTDTEGGQKVQGSLDWVSGKVYSWTLAYSGAGSATLEVRDGAALVLSLTYPSGMDAGNALELQVGTNASIGATTTITANAASINSQAVSAAVSQTGNNQESAQSLYFYYPPMSQGFTATGTVSLVYDSLPSGSRVQFSIRAGTIPCSNLAPTVSIIAPAAGSLHQAGSAIAISANAADTDGTVQSVQFLANAASIGNDTTSPYSIAWTPAAGSYSLTARATDNAGDQTLSAAVAITVNAQPTAVITSPASGSVVQAPGSVTLTATAADTDGTITKVDFYQGATLVGTATSSPYTVNVTGLAAGTYSFTAVATDNQNGTGTSAAVSVRVNAAPGVSITSPANNAVFNAPASFTLTANAADGDGTVQRVDFYQGATLLGSATASPFNFAVSGLAAGSYSFTAVAVDNDNAQTTSGAISVTVNALPAVSITSPAPGTVVQAPGSVTLTATASDADGTIAKVDFYQGATLVGTATSSPYTTNVTDLAAGTYSFTAIATDDRGATSTSAAVSVRVNAAPTVSLTSPASGGVFNAPATINLAASASDTDGSIAKVEFYQGATLVGTATSSPFTASVSGLASGSYSFTAVATDNDNAQTTSAAVSVTVNSAPAVSITSPAHNATFNAPANITITANATDSDGTINRVELYANASLIATLTASPYTFNWTGVGTGTYALTAKAVDNNNAETVSTAVNITVTVASTLYFIHPDHLNTPRLVADATGTTVWRWDQQEPFGNNPADENPSGLGAFDLPLRLPGQYYDKETNLSYNYFRDYDPSLGRYGESDPIGLYGGINSYAYGDSSPLVFVDPAGDFAFIPAIIAGAKLAGAFLTGYYGGQFAVGMVGSQYICRAEQQTQSRAEEEFDQCLIRQRQNKACDCQNEVEALQRAKQSYRFCINFAMNSGAQGPRSIGGKVPGMSSR